MTKVKRSPGWSVQLDGATEPKGQRLLLVGDGDVFTPQSNSRLYMFNFEDVRAPLLLGNIDYHAQQDGYGYDRLMLLVGPHHLRCERHSEHAWVQWHYDGQPVRPLPPKNSREYTLMNDGTISCWEPQD